MNAARKLIDEPEAMNAPTRHWTASATVYVSAAPNAGARASNDCEPAELIRDKITQAAIPADAFQPADDRDEPRALLSFNAAITGFVGALAALITIASLIAV